MPDDTSRLPSYNMLTEAHAVASLPMALQIFFNDEYFKRCTTVARYLAAAEGFTPRHLIAKNEACFAVVSRALSWKLDPFAVAQATYQTPGGQVGYYGALCQAILENSGHLEGGVHFDHFGDWSKVQRKFRIETSQKGGKYPVPAWKDADEDGLGVTVSAQVKGEAERRSFEFYLVQAFPRNSTLWATDPKTQICYTAVRRFATTAMPGLFMGTAFDREELDEWASSLKDVTPAPSRPKLAEYGEAGFEAPKKPQRAAKKEPEPPTTDVPNDTGEPQSFAFFDMVGVEQSFDTQEKAFAALTKEIATAQSERDLSTLRENCADFLATLTEDAAGMLDHAFNQRMEALATPGDANEGSVSSELVVPLPPQGIDGWYQPARKRVKEMEAAGCTPADFKRFREANAEHIAALKEHGVGWYRMLEELIQKGEAER